MQLRRRRETAPHWLPLGRQKSIWSLYMLLCVQGAKVRAIGKSQYMIGSHRVCKADLYGVVYRFLGKLLLDCVVQLANQPLTRQHAEQDVAVADAYPCLCAQCVCQSLSFPLPGLCLICQVRLQSQVGANLQTSITAPSSLQNFASLLPPLVGIRRMVCFTFSCLKLQILQLFSECSYLFL